MNRRLLIAALTGVSIILGIVLITWIARARNTAPVANGRELVLGLGYCNGDELEPCIASFSQDMENDLLITVLVPNAAYPDFYLMIERGGETTQYECEAETNLPTNILCIGEYMFPGEPLQFSLVAQNDNRVLAAGHFAIIGVMLFTPEAEPTVTLEQPAPTEPTAIALQTATSPAIFILPPATPTSATPSPTPKSSYPNP